MLDLSTIFNVLSKNISMMNATLGKCESAKEAFCHKILAGVDLLPQIFAIAPKAEN